jgi:hypothetical protein
MFLKFLVENKVVSEENLVEAVIAQYESMPSLLRVLKEDQILTAVELLDVLTQSISGKTTVFEILKKEGRLTSDDLNDLIKSQNTKAHSLGSILIEKGFVERDKFDLALRDYSKLDKKENSETESTSKPAAAPAGISAAALESLKAVGGVDMSQLQELEGQVSDSSSEASSELTPVEETHNEVEEANEEAASSEIDFGGVTVGEYLDFYSEEKQSELLVIANRFRLKGREKDLNLLHESLTKILSLCKLSNFSVQIKLLEAYESLFSHALNDPNHENLDWRPEPFSMLELLWEFRKVIEEGKNEVEVLSNPNLKNQYMESIKRILNLSKRSA